MVRDSPSPESLLQLEELSSRGYFSRSSGRGAWPGRSAHAAYARSSGLFSAPHGCTSASCTPRRATNYCLGSLVRQSREKQPVRNGEHRLVRAEPSVSALRCASNGGRQTTSYLPRRSLISAQWWWSQADDASGMRVDACVSAFAAHGAA